MLSRLVPAFLVGLLLSGLLSGELRAHEGRDHDAPVATAPASVIPRGEAVSERFEVVAVAQGAELILYLDRFATNAPVKDAAVAIETPDGPAKAEPKGDRSYRLAAPWLTKGGHVDLIVTVSMEGADDVLPLAFDIPAAASADQRTGSFWAKLTELLTPQMAAAAFGGLLIGIAAMAFGRRRSGVAVVLIALAPALVHIPAFAHEGHDHIEPRKPQAVAGDRATVLPGGVIFIPKPVQRIFELRTLLTETGSFKRTVELPGRIIPDPNASGFVQAAVGGRLAPPASGFPQLGARVKQGDVLAYVTQPMQAIDVSDMRQRQGELDQQISIVERRVKRFETLAPSGAVAQTQLDEARLELQGLRDRRASLDKIRREPEELVAPVAGVIAEGRPVAGQIVQSNAVIFQIVEPARLWIEALSFQALRDVQTASARTATGNVLSIAFRGSGFADRSQSVPVHFAVEDGADRLRAGEFVTVFVQTGDGKQGIALPRSAVIRASNGQDFVYEHVSAERFEARPVRTEPLDAERVLIAAGLDAGKRIVVQGAELVAHVR